MNVHVVYRVSNGEIRSRGSGFGVPPEGPIPYDEEFAILHADAHPNTHRVVDGVAVLKPEAEVAQQERGKALLKFKARRRQLLDYHEYKLMPHYPGSADLKSTCDAKFQQSRDIPNSTDDPVKMMEMLEAIWEGET